MIFAPVRLGETSLNAEAVAADKKSCKRFGPCGVGKEALFLNSYFIDRRYYVAFSSVRRVFKRVAMSQGGFSGKGVLQAAALGPEDGLQVHLGVVVQAGVGLPVEVDAQVRDAGQCPLRVHQTALHAVGSAHQQAACHAQGPVEPGGHQHAAVALHLGAGKAVVGPVQRLDAPGRRVTVAGCGVPAGERAFGHPPGQNGRAVAGGVVFAAGHKVPCRALRAVPVALSFQNGRGGRRGVERTDTGVQKRKQIFHGKCFVLHGDASFRFYWFYSL